MQGTKLSAPPWEISTIIYSSFTDEEPRLRKKEGLPKVIQQAAG